MIDGITVLNVESINRVPVYFWIIIVTIIVVSLAFCDSELFIVAFILSILATVVTCTFTEPVPTGRYEYEVTIDDTVSMTKLYEQYEIVEQRGDIWVLKDKEK